MSAVPRSRLQDLLKTQCRIFSQSYNPTNTRTGAKILRQRLRGAAIKAYYPPRYFTMRDLQAQFPKFGFVDEPQVDREEYLSVLQSKGKGAPKKKRTAEESKKFTKRRPGGAKPVTP